MVGSIERVLGLLQEAGVRYLVAGGVAVVLHGHLRTTADLDLLLDLAAENAGRAARALSAAGFQPRAPVAVEEFADPAIRRRWIEETHLEVFTLWHPRIPGFEVDLFATEPIDFERAWGRRVEVELHGRRVPVVAREDLIAMKRRAGRPVDLADIAALLAIAAAEEGDGEA